MGIHIVILGSGPAGLASAISLSKLSQEPNTPELSITLIELRPKLETIGGTLNVTPLAMRYLDYLGAAARVRARAIDMDSGLDYVSLRTGQRLGNIWGGIGSMRVIRHAIVESLLETLTKDHPNVKILWGQRVTNILEDGANVSLNLENKPVIEADLVLGCEGIHSATRSRFVDPQRKPYYTGRALAMGWAQREDPTKPPLELPTEEPALRDTLLISSQNGVLLSSYYEPSRTQIYFANIMYMDEPKDDNVRDGWRLRGSDREAMRRSVLESYQDGHVKGLQELLAKCENWHLYPAYVLPREGAWSRGRVLLLGDAAHAVSIAPLDSQSSRNTHRGESDASSRRKHGSCY